MTNTTADIVGEDPRIAHLDRTKQDTERELARVVDELAHVRETGAAELARASDDLVGAAVEIERQRQRADVAEQMVAELRGLLQSAHQAVVHEAGIDNDAQHLSDRIDAVLSRSEAVVGRWVSKENVDHLAQQLAAIMVERSNMGAERDAAIAARDEAVANLEAVASVRDAWIACARRMVAQRDEVGLQLAAAQERIKLLEQVAKEARAVLEDHDRSMIHLDDAVSALDAVPGDALASRITAALEASGIDSDNVKGVE